jgi:hypothetical protein
MKLRPSFLAVAALPLAAAAHAQTGISPADQHSWNENCGWMSWGDAPAADRVVLHPSFLSGFVWCENIGWLNLGDGSPAVACGGRPCYGNLDGSDAGVNLDPATGELSGLAWSENAGWVNFSGGADAIPSSPARIDYNARRLRGYAWGENIGWINLDDAVAFVGLTGLCGSADFDGDGDVGTDADIEAFFNCLAGNCCPSCGSADFDGDGDLGTDADIEAFFRVLVGGSC